METSRLTMYCIIAIIAILISLFFLTKEPELDEPINLIHLLVRH